MLLTLHGYLKGVLKRDVNKKKYFEDNAQCLTEDIELRSIILIISFPYESSSTGETLEILIYIKRVSKKKY